MAVVLLGTPDTSLSGLSTLNVLRVFKLMFSSEPAGRIIGRNLEKSEREKKSLLLDLLLVYPFYSVRDQLKNLDTHPLCQTNLITLKGIPCIAA